MHDSKTIYRNTRGSALLVALIIMGILMTVAIGISELLIRSYRDNRQMIDRTGAWYQAEAGIEHALLLVTQNPPGFEDNKENIGGPEESDPTSFYGYKIKAAAQQVPEKLYATQDPSEQFNALPLSQTITIPLFSGTHPEDGVKLMKIEYFLAPKIRAQGGNITSEEFPILRWKIFGKATNGSIEVISDIAPEVPTATDANTDTSCIGTPENCRIQGGPYFNNMGTLDDPKIFIEPRAYISTFLENHTQNFLILTNMVNINLIGGSVNDKKKLASVMYRVTQLDAPDDNRISLPTARITADGYNRNTKQSIDIEIDRERSLPIFNYALYKP